MDFGLVIERLAEWLHARGASFAVTGGVALAAYGHPRMTLGLDLVVDSDLQAPLIGFMEAQGYETLYRSEGYSNHLATDPNLGRVDFVYVRGATRDALFAASRRLPGPGGLKIPVVQPAHLVAMKVRAMANDRDRLYQDLADIRFLLQHSNVDLDEVRSRFEKVGLTSYFEELSRDL